MWKRSTLGTTFVDFGIGELAKEGHEEKERRMSKKNRKKLEFYVPKDGGEEGGVLFGSCDA